MFTSLASTFLNRVVGQYLDIDSQNLRISFWQGNIELEDVALKTEVIGQLGLPFDMKLGHIGKVKIVVPWKHLQSQPVSIEVHDVDVLVCPREGYEYDADAELDALDVLKETQLAVQDALLPNSEAASDTFQSTMFDKMLNNIEVSVTRIHIRFEASLRGSDAEPTTTAFGLMVDSLTTYATNASWEKRYSQDDAISHRLFQVHGVALYSQTNLCWADRLFQWEHLFHDPDIADKVDFILEPLLVTGKLKRTRRVLNLPRDSLEVEVEEFPLVISNMHLCHLALIQAQLSRYESQKSKAHAFFHSMEHIRPRMHLGDMPYDEVDDDFSDATGQRSDGRDDTLANDQTGSQTQLALPAPPEPSRLQQKRRVLVREWWRYAYQATRYLLNLTAQTPRKFLIDEAQLSARWEKKRVYKQLWLEKLTNDHMSATDINALNMLHDELCLDDIVTFRRMVDKEMRDKGIVPAAAAAAAAKEPEAPPAETSEDEVAVTNWLAAKSWSSWWFGSAQQTSSAQSEGQTTVDSGGSDGGMGVAQSGAAVEEHGTTSHPVAQSPPKSQEEHQVNALSVTFVLHRGNMQLVHERPSARECITELEFHGVRWCYQLRANNLGLLLEFVLQDIHLYQHNRDHPDALAIVGPKPLDTGVASTLPLDSVVSEVGVLQRTPSTPDPLVFFQVEVAYDSPPPDHNRIEEREASITVSVDTRPLMLYCDPGWLQSLTDVGTHFLRFMQSQALHLSPSFFVDAHDQPLMGLLDMVGTEHDTQVSWSGTAAIASQQRDSLHLNINLSAPLVVLPSGVRDKATGRLSSSNTVDEDLILVDLGLVRANTLTCEAQPTVEASVGSDHHMTPAEEAAVNALATPEDQAISALAEAALEREEKDQQTGGREPQEEEEANAAEGPDSLKHASPLSQAASGDGIAQRMTQDIDREVVSTTAPAEAQDQDQEVSDEESTDLDNVMSCLSTSAVSFADVSGDDDNDSEDDEFKTPESSPALSRRASFDFPVRVSSTKQPSQDTDSSDNVGDATASFASAPTPTNMTQPTGVGIPGAASRPSTASDPTLECHQLNLMDLQVLACKRRNWQQAISKRNSAFHIVERFSIECQVHRNLSKAHQSKTSRLQFKGTLPDLQLVLAESKLLALISTADAFQALSHQLQDVTLPSTASMATDMGTSLHTSMAATSTAQEAGRRVQRTAQLKRLVKLPIDTKLFNAVFSVQKVSLEVRNSCEQAFCSVVIQDTTLTFTQRPSDTATHFTVSQVAVIDMQQPVESPFRNLIHLKASVNAGDVDAQGPELHETSRLLEQTNDAHDANSFIRISIFYFGDAAGFGTSADERYHGLETQHATFPLHFRDERDKCAKSPAGTNKLPPIVVEVSIDEVQFNINREAISSILELFNAVVPRGPPVPQQTGPSTPTRQPSGARSAARSASSTEAPSRTVSTGGWLSAASREADDVDMSVLSNSVMGSFFASPGDVAQRRLKVTATLSSVSALLVADDNPIAKCAASGIELRMDLMDKYSRTQGRLQSVEVTDLTPYGCMYRNVFSTCGDDMLTFTLRMGDAQMVKPDIEFVDEESRAWYESNTGCNEIKYANDLQLHIGAMQYVHTKRFTTQIQSFVEHIVSSHRIMSTMGDVASGVVTNLQSGVEVDDFTKLLHFNVSVASPVVIVPQNSFASRAVVAHLGTTRVSQAFRILPPSGRVMTGATGSSIEGGQECFGILDCVQVESQDMKIVAHNNPVRLSEESRRMNRLVRCGQRASNLDDGDVSDAASDCSGDVEAPMSGIDGLHVEQEMPIISECFMSLTAERNLCPSRKDCPMIKVSCSVQDIQVNVSHRTYDLMLLLLKENLGAETKLLMTKEWQDLVEMGGDKVQRHRAQFISTEPSLYGDEYIEIGGYGEEVDADADAEDDEGLNAVFEPTELGNSSPAVAEIRERTEKGRTPTPQGLAELAASELTTPVYNAELVLPESGQLQQSEGGDLGDHEGDDGDDNEEIAVPAEPAHFNAQQLWVAFQLEIQLEGVTFSLFHLTDQQEIIPLSSFQVKGSKMSFQSSSDGTTQDHGSDISLECRSFEIIDQRRDERPNHFRTLLTPITDDQPESSVGARFGAKPDHLRMGSSDPELARLVDLTPQFCVVAHLKPNAQRIAVTLNKTKLFLSPEWAYDVIQFLSRQSTSEIHDLFEERRKEIEGEPSSAPTPAQLSTTTATPPLHGSRSATGSPSPLSAKPIPTPTNATIHTSSTATSTSVGTAGAEEPDFSAVINVSDAEFVVVNDVTSLQSDAIVLKTGVNFRYDRSLKVHNPDRDEFRGKISSNKLESANLEVRHLEVFTCQIHQQQRTALSLLDPTNLSLELQRRFHTESIINDIEMRAEASTVGQQQPLNVRFSYNDLALCLEVAQRFAQWSKDNDTRAGSPVSQTSHQHSCESLELLHMVDQLTYMSPDRMLCLQVLLESDRHLFQSFMELGLLLRSQSQARSQAQTQTARTGDKSNTMVSSTGHTSLDSFAMAIPYRAMGSSMFGTSMPVSQVIQFSADSLQFSSQYRRLHSELYKYQQFEDVFKRAIHNAQSEGNMAVVEEFRQKLAENHRFLTAKAAEFAIVSRQATDAMKIARSSVLSKDAEGEAISALAKFGFAESDCAIALEKMGGELEASLIWLLIKCPRLSPTQLSQPSSPSVPRSQSTPLHRRVTSPRSLSTPDYASSAPSSPLRSLTASVSDSLPDDLALAAASGRTSPTTSLVSSFHGEDPGLTTLDLTTEPQSNPALRAALGHETHGGTTLMRSLTVERPAAASPLQRYSVRVICDSMNLCVIDDSNRKDVPLLNLQAQKFSLNSDVTQQGQTEVKLDVAAVTGCDVFNPELSAWEPLVEQCNYCFSVDWEDGSKATVGLYADQRLDCVVSPVLLNTLIPTLQRWTTTYSDKAQRRSRVRFVPYRIQNETGLAIKVTPRMNGVVFDSVDVQPTTEEHVRDIDFGGSWHKHRHADVRHQVQSRQIKIDPQDFDCYDTYINVDREGSYVVRLRSLTRSQQAYVYVNVAQSEGRKLITVSSGIVVKNRTAVAMELQLKSLQQSGASDQLASKAPLLRVSHVSPRQSLHLPIGSHRCSLSFRPHSSGYKFSSETICFDLTKAPGKMDGFMATCHSFQHHAVTSSSGLHEPFNCSVSWVRHHVQKYSDTSCFTVTLLPPLVISNMLPIPIMASIMDTPQQFPLEAGDSFAVKNIDMAQNISLAIQQVTASPSAQLSKAALIKPRNRLTNPDSFIQFQNTFVRVLNKTAEHTGGARAITLSVDYWFVNHTTLPLIYLHDSLILPSDDPSSPRPVLFSANEPKPMICVKVKSSTSRYQQLVLDQDSPPQEIRIPNSPTPQEYYIGVEMKMGAGRFRDVTIVTFVPRYIVTNNTANTISLQQASAGSGSARMPLTQVHAGEGIPFHWATSTASTHLVSFRLSAAWKWTRPCSIDKVGTTYIRCYPQATGSNAVELVRIDVSMAGSSFQVALSLAGENPPFCIKNHSRVPIKYAQRECPKHTLLPNSKTPFAWERKSLRELELSTEEMMVSCNFEFSAVGHRSLKYKQWCFLVVDGGDFVVGAGESQGEDGSIICAALRRKDPTDAHQLWSYSNQFLINKAGYYLQASKLGLFGSQVLLARADTIVGGPEAKRQECKWWWQGMQLVCKRRAQGSVAATSAGHYVLQVNNTLHDQPQAGDALVTQPASNYNNRSQHFNRELFPPGSGEVCVRVSTEGATRIVALYDREDVPATHPVVSQATDLTVSLAFKGGIFLSILDSTSLELALLACQTLEVKARQNSLLQNVSVAVHQLQLDNQIPTNPKYAVMMRCIEQSGKSKRRGAAALGRSSTVLTLEVEKSRESLSGAMVFHHIEVAIPVLQLRLDERQILFIARALFPLRNEALRAIHPDNVRLLPDSGVDLDATVQPMRSQPFALSMASGAYFERVTIHECHLDLSMNPCKDPDLIEMKQALSLPFFATEGIGLTLNRFALVAPSANERVLTDLLSNHYTEQINKQLLKFVGGLKLLGNPVGLIRNIRGGLASYKSKGVVSATGSMVSGIFQAGASASTEWANQMSQLSLDPRFQKRRVDREEQKSWWSNVKHFGESVASGVVGVVMRPIEGARDGAFMTGLVSGITGMVSKPLVGILDLVSEAQLLLVMKESGNRRLRTPRAIWSDRVVRPYSDEEAMFRQWLLDLGYLKGGEQYIAHVDLGVQHAFVTTERIVAVQMNPAADVRLTISSEIWLSGLVNVTSRPSRSSTSHYVTLTVREEMMQHIRRWLERGNEQQAATIVTRVWHGQTTTRSFKCQSKAVADQMLIKLSTAHEAFKERERQVQHFDDNMMLQYN
eukprot:m.48084 g.48084  ORF g.48084 m.48084 type:complete len:4330 (-) comp11009_c0_seq1:451-13440(-)